MPTPLATWRALGPLERRKGALLTFWFFLTIATLWILKPIRSASLLTHLGAAELPYVRLATVIVVAIVVTSYSRVVDRFERVTVARTACWSFAAVLMILWGALAIGGEALGGQRWFVWSVFILVDLYSTVMIGIFWIYANDIVSAGEADRLYGPVGVGGTIGGVVGGASVDSLVRLIGPLHLLLLSAALCVVSGMVVWAGERALRLRPRRIERTSAHAPGAATQGWREVIRSQYLLLIVGVVVTYEFAAAMTDFVVNVVFERAFSSEIVLAQMFGRLGWIVSVTALVSQVLLVPMVLPLKRLALLIPPVVMGMAAIGLALVPVAAMAIVLSTADRGLNYSLQQAAKETLYVPLTDSQKYKGKAVIDMVFDRLGKAASAIALILLIMATGMSIRLMLGVALLAIALWVACAWRLGRVYVERTTGQGVGIPSAA